MQKEVLVPLSIGEIVDKITILTIKSQRIGEAAKLANVHKELDALVAVCKKAGIDLTLPYFKELQAINETLWDVEDAIREKERQSAFDAEFISLARAVYRTNDRRGDIKREINALSGSAFAEEKSYKPY